MNKKGVTAGSLRAASSLVLSKVLSESIFADRGFLVVSCHSSRVLTRQCTYKVLEKKRNHAQGQQKLHAEIIEK